MRTFECRRVKVEQVRVGVGSRDSEEGFLTRHVRLALQSVPGATCQFKCSIVTFRVVYLLLLEGMSISALHSFAELDHSDWSKIKLPEPPSNAFAPEEPIFLDVAEGFGHYPFAAAERELDEYILKRKVSKSCSIVTVLMFDYQARLGFIFYRLARRVSQQLSQIF